MEQGTKGGQVTQTKPRVEGTKTMADLNPKQKKFIEFYVRDQNATEAAKQAGYSEKTAYAQGSALLKHPEIKSEIDRRQNYLTQTFSLRPR